MRDEDEPLWEDPPDNARVHSRWDKMREHPGRWARICRSGSERTYRKAHPDFAFKTASVDGVVYMYGCYVGDGREPLGVTELLRSGVSIQNHEAQRAADTIDSLVAHLRWVVRWLVDVDGVDFAEDPQGARIMEIVKEND